MFVFIRFVHSNSLFLNSYSHFQWWSCWCNEMGKKTHEKQIYWLHHAIYAKRKFTHRKQTNNVWACAFLISLSLMLWNEVHMLLYQSIVASRDSCKPMRPDNFTVALNVKPTWMCMCKIQQHKKRLLLLWKNGKMLGKLHSIEMGYDGVRLERHTSMVNNSFSKVG